MNQPVRGRLGRLSAADTLSDTQHSCRSAPLLWVHCRRQTGSNQIKRDLRLIKRNWKFSPIQQVTGSHTLTPANKVAAGHAHVRTRTPAALLRALRVTSLVLLLCINDTVELASLAELIVQFKYFLYQYNSSRACRVSACKFGVWIWRSTLPELPVKPRLKVSAEFLLAKPDYTYGASLLIFSWTGKPELFG